MARCCWVANALCSNRFLDVVLSWLLVDDCVAVALPSSLMVLKFLSLFGTVCGVVVVLVVFSVVAFVALVPLVVVGCRSCSS